VSAEGLMLYYNGAWYGGAAALAKVFEINAEAERNNPTCTCECAKIYGHPIAECVRAWGDSCNRTHVTVLK
jgi:hypothetical protein